MAFGEEVLPYLSITALSSTVGLFLCGFQICSRIQQRGTTDGTSPAPFLLPFISCAFFVQYGVLKNDNVIITTNCVGFALYSLYLSYFYLKTRNRRFLNKIIFVELMLIVGMVYYTTSLELPHETALTHLGNVCIVLNIASIGAPLLEIGKIIRTKSSESLPLPLCIACFLVSIQWLFYGIIVEDSVIIFPNCVATFISVIQLSLFVIYPAAPTYSKFHDYSHEI
ncbi:unnamed protein product [Caenorhabditis bovis]|uniref:Sugar transporter SWEET n=1 Tax=Caenorhabditis bovis TaxID=2654633 RepID=A0A8S1ELV2_9PELO|nr:unnamed protein product [Caenorhabditis bovis]